MINKKIHKVVALTLAIVFLGEIISPTLALALTSMDTQPEVMGYQPVDATDNVALTSGAFNYTIPITSIPEYPMAIGYSAGARMDQEGGVFGLGFNGFSGAISRNMLGLPDDLNGASGAKKQYHYENQKKWDVSGTGTLGASVGIGAGLGVGASVSMKIGYNNYTGVYGALGIGLGLQAKLGESNLAGGLGASLTSDSRQEGIGFGVGAGLGISAAVYNGKGTASSTLAGYGFNKTLDGKSNDWTHAGSMLGSLGKSVFPSPTSSAVTSLSPLSYVLANNTGFGASLTVPIPVGGALSISVTAAYSQFKVSDDPIDMNAYGFLYLNNYKRDDPEYESLADMTIEGEDSYNELARNAPSYLQRDYFSINAMGMSGTMQLHQREYGIVSRNRSRTQFRNIDANSLSLKTDRQEVYPWLNVSQTKINKSVDILALLKKKDNPEAKDFDNVLFDEAEVESLNRDKHKFGQADFKMRGDLVGEYNLSSSDFQDHEPNKYDLLHYTGINEDPQFKFLGEEKNIPLYYPNPIGSTQTNYDQGDNGTIKIEKSTNIRYSTVGGLLNAYNQLNPNDGSPAAFNFNQSFHSHYQYTHPNVNKETMVSLNGTNQESFNILERLKELSTGRSYFNDLIGSVEVQSVSGMRYFFGLPVFNKTAKSVQLSGKDGEAPDIGGSNYVSGDGVNRNKLTTEDQFIYPYAWLLTAVVGDDYIDFDNIPGPSDGDIGYWVKFKYVRASDNYRWRAPFTGLNNIPGMIHNNQDDFYSFSTGTKEIYYLSEIESSNYLCKYAMHKRYDAWDAAVEANGEAHNSLMENAPAPTSSSLGSNFQFLVTQIDLYKKHDSGNNSETRTTANPFGLPIKSTKFEYDYSLCPNVPNNYARYNTSIPIAGNVPYYYTGSNATYVENGKATLRRVQHLAYDAQGIPIPLPSYQFSYWGDGVVNSPYNPDYDHNQVDQWGNYIKNGKAPGLGNTNVNYYQHYTELTKTEADENSRVFNLSEITMPSGGSMNIDYQAQSYGQVQDKTPYVMRQLINVETSGSRHARVTIDISDIESPETLQSKKVLQVGDMVYGEITFYQVTNPASLGNIYKKENETFIATADSLIVTNFGTVTTMGNKRYQEVEVFSPKLPDLETPFVYEFKQFMYTESKYMRIIKEVGCGSAAQLIAKYSDAEKDGAVEAARKVVANIKAVFVKDDTFQDDFNACFRTAINHGFDNVDLLIYPHWSFLRTPIYKGKYTGCSVKSIVLKDGFNYATDPQNPSVPKTDENEYGTNYFYDASSDGTGVSSGVVTIEPGGGKSAIIDIYATTGAGFVPSPLIISSKTTLENKYNAEETANTPIGEKVSRKKGKTVYEFYTAKDEGYRFNENFKQGTKVPLPGSPYGRFYLFGIFTMLAIKFKIFKKQITIKVPAWIPLTIKWDRHDQYHVNSYAYTDYTDIYGRPKSIVQQDASGLELGKQQFVYYGKDEPVTVFNPGFTSSDVKRPGKMDQSWSEAYYSKEARINQLLLFLRAETNRNFSFTNMKYSYVPPVLKEVYSTLDGLTTTTQNTAYDYYNNTPLEVKSKDSYGNTKIIRTVPAYWHYTGMGASSVNDSYVNNLTASAGTYMYLNSVDVNNHNLLGAGIVEWKSSLDNGPDNSWKIIDYIQPQRKYISSTEFKYVYNHVTGAEIKGSYADRSDAPVKGNNLYIRRNAAIYKTYKGYTYETALDVDGTFKNGNFTPFNYASTSNTKWKLLSTNEFYAQNGVLVQSKDVLKNYAAQLLGYHFSNTIGAVSNASWGASAYDGAENTYERNNSADQYYLESNKFELINAEVIEACKATYDNKNLNFTDFPLNGSIREATVLTVLPPASPVYNSPFAKLDVTYYNGIKRSLYVSLKDDGSYSVISDKGEEFNGYFSYKQADGSTQLAFLPSDFTSIVKDNSFPPSGTNFTATLSFNTPITDCNLEPKAYQVPNNNCITEAHTGKYAFNLKGGNAVGTRYTLAKSNTLVKEELFRKYKTLVWVHNSSPDVTELVVEYRHQGNVLFNTLTTSKATPYAKAGNWTLLRLDFDLSTGIAETDFVEIFMRNPSSFAEAVYDDIRVLPYHADMTNWVFDHQFNRVVSGLDNDNFASYSNFDQRGRVVNSFVELEDAGKTPVQKFLYNDQKKN